jgi:hypothetical protein
MAAVTRFGLEGYGVRRAGSFSGKPAAGLGPITRFGLEGYGVRRAGSFSGKPPSTDLGGDEPRNLPMFVTTGRLKSF